MTRQNSPADFPITLVLSSAVIELPGRLSVLEAVGFKQTCHQLLEEKPMPQKIILDCQKTKFIDSSGIGAIIHNFKAAKERRVKLILRNVHTPVMAVLSMTGLEKLLSIESLVENNTQSSQNSSLNQLPKTHPSVHSWIKRLIDIVGSLVGLAITAIIFIPIVIAIKRDSPGPIFFGQIRCGWMGKRFRIWKFRSMCINAEKLKYRVRNQAQGAFFKNDNDPRITRIGSFLRRTSLDEMPQFWNVLRGEMSLVGTRPPTPEEVESYEVPEWQRLDVKPGMTGEWQVSGRSQIRNFQEVIELDLRYQQNWSLLYDIEIIWKTILILFNKNSGAV